MIFENFVPRRRSRVLRAVMTLVDFRKRFSVRRSIWSKCAWESRTKSIGGSSGNVSAGSVRRLGPSVKNGRRIPIRLEKTGSVMIIRPKKLISTVEWPSHAAVTSSSLHTSGVGFANAGAIGRRLSTVHSRQRCASQFRRCILRRLTSRSVSIWNDTQKNAGECKSLAQLGYLVTHSG